MRLLIFIIVLSLAGCVTVRNSVPLFELRVKSDSKQLDIESLSSGTILESPAHINGFRVFQLCNKEDTVKISAGEHKEIHITLYQINVAHHSVKYEPEGRVGGVHLGPYASPAPLFKLKLTYSDELGFNVVSLVNKQ